MPNYDYKCKKCGYRFTALHSIREEALSVCSRCGGELVRLLTGGAGVIYKGAGFYVNDYKKKEERTEKRDKADVSS